MSRRAFWGVLVVTWCFSAGCKKSAPPAPTRGLAPAVQYLLDAQQEDGTWRSDMYPAFRDGASLTPLIVIALQAAEPILKDASVEYAIKEGARYLASLVKEDGTIDPGEQGLSYPVYTAAYAIRALSHPHVLFLYHKQRNAWREYLRKHQLTEARGWSPEDKEYGGWGYASEIPNKPKPGELAPGLVDSNMSATVAALEALRVGGAKKGDPAWAPARIFVQRCQNYSEKPEELDDGGFFHIYDDPVRNKAGPAPTDEGSTSPGETPETQRFYSYGSATADGLRSLRALGADVNDPRAFLAATWLRTRFDPNKHPGKYNPGSESNRDGIYFYYMASVAQAFQKNNLAAPKGWKNGLLEALKKRQRDDGTFKNDNVLVREDDPLVATPLAVLAMAIASMP